jgi:membrane associated rhomboid family serine protease
MEPSQAERFAPRRFGFLVPWVSGGLIATSVAMFLATGALGNSPRGSSMAAQLALYGPNVLAGEWWRILTTTIVHAGVLHLFLNMSVVFTLGFSFERLISSWRFLLVSLIAAIGSATFVLQFAFDQRTVGASGMILGWAGALLPIANRQARRSLGMWLLQIAIISLIPGISWQGHLGGFLFGLPCGFLLRGRARWFGTLAPLLLVASAGAAWLAAQTHEGRFYSVGNHISDFPRVEATRKSTCSEAPEERVLANRMR